MDPVDSGPTTVTGVASARACWEASDQANRLGKHKSLVTSCRQEATTVNFGVATMSCELWVASLVLLSAVTVGQHADERQLGTTLQLTKVAGAGDSVKRLESLLLCNPVGGDHPNGAAACRDLGVASSDFDRLPGDPRGVCGAVYDPVTVTANGIWEGKPVDFAKTYDNPCKLYLRTGPVFEF
jgi:hypothetical protein